MADYIQRLYQARQSRDSPEPFLDVLHPRNSWDSKQVSMAPSNFTQDTYSRLMDHKSHVSKKVSDLRKKKKADELGYKGISPDRKKVNNRKENMLINR
jgi:predicted  nucleic acid-binding Zn ribbon protein